jgi:hypothetical protein
MCSSVTIMSKETVSQISRYNLYLCQVWWLKADGILLNFANVERRRMAPPGIGDTMCYPGEMWKMCMPAGEFSCILALKSVP